MSKVIAIGRRADILPLRAAGVELLEAETEDGAVAAFESVLDVAEPTIVMLTENYEKAVAKQLEEFRRGPLRAVLSIPSLAAPAGARYRQVRSMVARALGVDLLGRDEK